MDAAVANLGWTEDQWNRVCSTVVEEAQKARVAAQALPCTGPEDKSILAIPRYEVATPGANPDLEADSDPDLYITRISVNVALRSHEVADHQLGAALQMFRRAANVIARVEDSLVFYGRRSVALNPAVSALNYLTPGLPAIYNFTQDTHNVDGVFQWLVGPTPLGDPGIPLARGRFRRPAPVARQFRAGLAAGGASLGDGVVNTIIAAISAIEGSGYYGPFACCLSNRLFEAICTPAPSLVLPRDRILPFLQGPLLRASALDPDDGVVISLAGTPVELVIASEIYVRFLQVTQAGRALFRVSERVALRIKSPGAIQRIRS
jgi:uncharacterized linocin/CFP29 family protein